MGLSGEPDAEASPRTPRALMLGAPGPYPFNGHVRLRFGDAQRGLDLAASVATDRPPPVARAAAEVLEGAWMGLSTPSRVEALRAVWERLAAVEPTRMGPSRGEDLALLLVAWDPGGVAVAGTGLAALFRPEGGKLVPFLPSEHPLFSLGGVPSQPPRYLTPTHPPRVLLGSARTGSLDPSSVTSWARLTGFRE